MQVTAHGRWAWEGGSFDSLMNSYASSCRQFEFLTVVVAHRAINNVTSQPPQSLAFAANN
jgi:hypothetical protein